MIQLGLAAFFHDSAACIVKNGRVLSAVEEERFTEIKHDYSFPINAINWVLQDNNLSIDDIDEVCWYENPSKKKDRVIKTFNKRWWKTWNIKRKFKKDFAANDPVKLLSEIGYIGKITYVDHHLSHAAFGYYTSKFDDAAILTVDGVGEWETVTISTAENGKISKRFSIDFPNSLGMLYSTITSYLGFKPNEGEYKVMGLAPYGDPEKYAPQLRKVFKRTSNKFYINQKYFTWEYSDKVMFNKHLFKLLGVLPRFPEEDVTQDHKDLAAALQRVYEEEFLRLVNVASKITTSKNLVLSGGCAYNGVANSKAYKVFRKIHVPYAPSDAGSAIGACLYRYVEDTGDIKKKPVNRNPFLGPKYSDDNVLGVLKNTKGISYANVSTEKLIKTTAEFINSGQIVAWFQGKMEFGARALGNRSILATPRDPEMRTKLNYVIKKREGFRPFAPSTLKGEDKKWFEVREDIPYMNQVVKIRGHRKKHPAIYFPSATHVDNTARVHTVTRGQNFKYYKLLEELKRTSGYGIVLNTSFNLKDQTITMTPKQAVDRFINSDIDRLIINNFIVTKDEQR